MHTLPRPFSILPLQNRPTKNTTIRFSRKTTFSNMSGSNQRNRSCLGILFTLGLAAFFMWLILRPSKPTLSIEQFYVPALNKTAISNLSATIPPVNTTVAFHLKLRNENKDKGVYYDALNITLYYGPDHSVVGNLTLDSFYQGHKKTAHRMESMKAKGRAFWENATRAVSERNSTVFRVGLWTAVRYKIYGIKTKRHRFRLVADVDVNAEGAWPKRKGVKFHSRAAAQAGYRARLGAPLALLVLLVVW
ncbi:protein NDR1-like [Magnolia sinica]|uniref:protein NDR1-like n=1 Tax=Magnolia sinica TaxID=86752 RepID=UPI00265811B7|nr:protein NDR1-like [Magnolia sinica]